MIDTICGLPWNLKITPMITAWTTSSEHSSGLMFVLDRRSHVIPACAALATCSLQFVQSSQHYASPMLPAASLQSHCCRLWWPRAPSQSLHERHLEVVCILSLDQQPAIWTTTRWLTHPPFCRHLKSYLLKQVFKWLLTESPNNLMHCWCFIQRYNGALHVLTLYCTVVS